LEGRKKVIIFIIAAVTIPSLIFCGFVFLNFQHEINEGRRRQLLAAKAIADSQDEQAEDDGEVTTRQTLVWSSETPVRVAHSGDSNVPEPAFREIYQFESAYFGPFLIVPLGPLGRPATVGKSVEYGSRPGVPLAAAANRR
jgi:hypothetical protein